MSFAHNDFAADKDSLGMDARCKGIADFIQGCSTPMTVAIQGDWGTGKSTCMNLIRQHLEKDHESAGKKLCVIDFNTWQYSILSDNSKLIISLLDVLADRLEEIKNDPETGLSDDEKKGLGSAANKLKFVIKAVANTAIEYASDTDVGKAVNGTLKSVKNRETEGSTLIADVYSSLLLARKVIELKETVREMTELLIRSEKFGKHIYIFIDDLDRLRPEYAVELMECLKNFMDCEGLVFLLAVDREVVDNGLKKKYGEDFDREKAVKFFDKIIQVPFTLPVNSYDISAYLADFVSSGEIIGRYADLLRDFGERNPRTIKRSFNVLTLSKCMYRAGSGLDDMTPLKEFRLYSLLLLQLERKNEHQALLDILIPFGNDHAALKEQLNAALARTPEDLEKSSVIRLTARQRTVLGCFCEDDGKLLDEGVESLTELAALTNEHTGEVTHEEKMIRIMRSVYHLIKDHVVCGDEWKVLDEEGIPDKLGLTAFKPDDGEEGSTPEKALAFNWYGGRSKLNLTVYTGLDAAAAFSGVRESFVELREGNTAPEGKYGYHAHAGRITVANFKEYRCGGPIDVFLHNCLRSIEE